MSSSSEPRELLDQRLRALLARASMRANLPRLVTEAADLALADREDARPARFLALALTPLAEAASSPQEAASILDRLEAAFADPHADVLAV